jgi:hypothetical protein
MTQTQASEAVEDYVKSLEDTQFTLSVDGRSVVATAEDLGVTWANTGLVEEALNVGKTGNLIERYKSKKDLEHESMVLDISYTADEEQVKSFLNDHASEVNQDAVNYGLVRENGAFTITEGQNGVAVDVDQSAADIVSYIENTWNESDASLDLAATVVEPEGTEEQLQRVKDVLGTYTLILRRTCTERAQRSEQDQRLPAVSRRAVFCL